MKAINKTSVLIVAIFVCATFVLVSDSFAGLDVKITSPTNKAQFEACDPIKMSAEVTATDGSEIKDLYFFAGSKSLGRIKAEPWETTWEGAPWGIYPIYARVRDTNSESFYSDTLYITVGNPGEGSIIFNGGFDCGLWPWAEETFDGGAFSTQLLNDQWFNDSSYAALIVEDVGNVAWSCQLTQPVKLDSGHTYSISLYADAPMEKALTVLLQNSSDPYNEFWKEQLTITEYGEYGPFEFLCEESSNTVKFKLIFGMDANELYVDEIVVVDLDAEPVAVENRAPSTVHGFSLYQNYPNPFNMETTIRYELASPSDVVVGIYNLNGQLVRSFEAGTLSSGQHALQWDGTDMNSSVVPTGVYLYRLTAVSGNETIIESKKMIVLK